jgi:hypothetical protein
MADSSSFGIVTLWIASFFETGKTEQGHYFVSREFNTFDAGGISTYLKDWQTKTRDSDIPFIV